MSVVPARIAAFLIALLLLPALAAAQEAPRVFLVTIGPGELPYERFGHNALLFIDPASDQSVAYDWGRFDFDQPAFLWRFVRGQMLYQAGREDGDLLVYHYTEVEGRRVVLQELNLTPEQRRALLRACEIGYRPENRDYRYDYFIANCSTRLRDVLDDALGGQIREQLVGRASGTTFRREAERHMAPDWPLWLGMHATLGMRAEREIDAWEQTFLPLELKRWLREVSVEDAEGRALPLVARETVLSAGALPPVAADRPSRWWQTGLLGVGLGGAMVLLSLIGRGLAGRLAAAGWFLLAGFGGGFLLWVWAFSEHWGAHANQTALLLSPLGLALAVLVLVERWERARIWLAGGHLLLCGLGVLLFAIPGVGQEHAGVVALAVPANLGAAWVAGLRPGRLAGRRAGWGGGRSAVADEGGEVAAAGGAAAG